jgi:quercetin dioxygenase-like cupin family protein
VKTLIIAREQPWTEGRVKLFSGKELISQENGGLKLVKVEPGASYPLHVHPDKTEYAYVLEGSPEFSVGDETHSSQPGEFVIFPANVKHAIRNKTRSGCVLLVGSIKV